MPSADTPDSGNGAPPRRTPQTPPAPRPQEAINLSSKTEALEPAVEILRPLLRDPSQAPQAVAKMVTAVQMFRGPLPPPDVFRGYNEVVPGSGREILDMAKREQRHRHRMQILEIIYPYLGWLAGFVCFLSCLAGAVYLAMNDRPAVAGILLGVPCLGVISWFIRSRLADTGSASPAVAPTKQTSKRRR